MSAKANDSDSFAASILKVINSELTDDQLKEIKESRVLNLYLDKSWADTDGSKTLPMPDAKFMEKPTGDKLQENQIQHDTDFIYQVAQIPNLDNVDFSTSAAQALDFKIHSMKIKALNKETKMKKALTQIWACALQAQGIDVNDVDNLGVYVYSHSAYCWLKHRQLTNYNQLPHVRQPIASLYKRSRCEERMQKISAEQDEEAEQTRTMPII